MADGDRGQADEGGAILVLATALYRLAAQRIGSVQHPQREPHRRAGAHGVKEGGGIGEITGAHVLHIEDHEIKTIHHGTRGGVSRSCLRLLCFWGKHEILKQGVDGQPGQLVDAAGYLFSRSQHAPNAMLGGKEGCYGEVGVHDLYRTEIAVRGRDARGVGNQPDLLIFKMLPPLGGGDAVDPDLDHGTHECLLKRFVFNIIAQFGKYFKFLVFFFKNSKKDSSPPLT